MMGETRGVQLATYVVPGDETSLPVRLVLCQRAPL
jgi:hypothetical protein